MDPEKAVPEHVVLAPAWVFPLFKMSARSASIAVMMMTVQAAVRPLRDFNSVAIVGVLRGGGDVRMATIIDTARIFRRMVQVLSGPFRQ